jgi:ElaB/YqjD/DUF883 family membrane-anchored ribosome-binding protein
MARTDIPGSEDWTDGPASVNETIAESVSDMADAAQHRVGRLADQVADGVRHTANQLRTGKVKQFSDDVMRYAKANPSQALIVAALVGFVVGRFLPRE